MKNLSSTVTCFACPKKDKRIKLLENKVHRLQARVRVVTVGKGAE